ncbi:MAG: NADH-quinone oxidoreductase subunit C [Candidatus Omnitrophota bacterium]|nr:NADH-quinone oxidoreductase subunit C [Candidatus Omnitrophota bacterium]
MDFQELISDLRARHNVVPVRAEETSADEVYLHVRPEDFHDACLGLHKILQQPVWMLSAADERRRQGGFQVLAVFPAPKLKKWVFVAMALEAGRPRYPSVAKDMFSAHLFERSLHEMFGIVPEGNPDLRRLNLHDEVWPEGSCPLRKDFVPPAAFDGTGKKYPFIKGEGEGIFEVPVGPVHAGIIGPGHFRFTAAGEPIINLELRLGFTHRGAEKHFEGKDAGGAAARAECVAGDAAFAHGLAFCHAVEKINGVPVPVRAQLLRAVFLELERLYNHASDIGGMAVDVGFSFPSALASLIKEKILRLNQRLTGHRYLKGVNAVGGLLRDITPEQALEIREALADAEKDFRDLRAMLFASVSFMDRVDSTGVLKKRTARDLGVKGLAGRASGIPQDLRKDFPGVYESLGFRICLEEPGDVLARLRVRLSEFEESARLIRAALAQLPAGDVRAGSGRSKPGFALGCAESWRGPVLYWVRISEDGAVDRCHIVDPSVQNWQGLAYCVLGDIIPDFPLCNKSFDLSYAGNDL